MVGKVIDVDQAKLSKVSVDIQVVRVGGKQMTLAVFRQLVHEPLIDWKTLQLRGVPWGWVNYHKDCRFGKHLHIIWQAGNRLLRSDVYQDHIFSKVPQWTESCRRAEEFIADTAAVRFLRRGDEAGFWQELREKLERNGTIDCRLGRINFFVHPEKFTVLQAVKNFLWRKEERWRIEAEATLRNKYGKVPDFEELWERVQVAVGEAERVLQKWEEFYASLESLPQLFIAV